MTPAHVMALIPQWIRCRAWILKALEYAGGFHNEWDVLSGLLLGHYQLWPGGKSALVTEIKIAPRKKYLHYWLAGGDLDEILEMEKSITAWAKSLGCTAVSLSGRKGWTKALPDWKEQCVTLVKELSHI